MGAARGLLFGMVSLLVTNSILSAGTWTLSSGTVGNWSTPSNWGGLLPSGTAEINNGGTARINPSDSINLRISLGKSGTRGGNIIQEGGTVLGTLYVGENNQGTYLQKGGTLKPTRLSVASNNGAQGTFTIEGGYLEPSSFDGIRIADFYSLYGGSGQYIQKGGYVKTQHFYGGMVGTASISIEGGILDVSDTAYFGYSGTCNVVQTSGTVGNMTGLMSIEIGVDKGATSTYELRGGSLRAPYLYVGDGTKCKSWGPATPIASGTLRQTGGSVECGTLVVGQAPLTADRDCYGIGRYEMNGGTLSGTYLYVGNGQAVNGTPGGIGSFVQTNGTAAVGILYVAGSSGASGTCEFAGGSMTAEYLTLAGTMNMSGVNATFTVTRGASFSASARLAAVTDSHMHVTGTSFSIVGTNPTSMAGLENLALYVDSQTTTPMTLEACGRDYGAVLSGFTSNFALDSLIIGQDTAGRTKLTDAYDNQPSWTGKDAVYVRNLEINAGSQLDLNGFNLYYLVDGVPRAFTGTVLSGDANMDGIVDQADYTRWYNNYGSIAGWTSGDFTGDRLVDQADYTVWYNNYGAGGAGVPEPATLALLGVGALAVLRRRARGSKGRA